MYTLKIAPVLHLKIIHTSVRTASIASHPVNAIKENHVKPWKSIPGPSTLPIVGQLHHFLPGGSLSNVKRYDLLKELHQRYGPIVRLEIIFAPPTAFIVDPDTIAYILRGENSQPNRPGLGSAEYYRKYYKKSEEQIMDPNRVTGLGSAQGEEWKRIRSVVGPLMLPPDNLKRFSKQIDEIAEDTTLRYNDIKEILKNLRDENNMVPNIIEELKIWSAEVTAYVALGSRIWTSSIFDQDSTVRRLTQQVTKYFACSAKLDFNPSVWKFYPTKNFRDAMDALEEIEKITNHYVQMAKDDLKKKNKTDEEKTLLQQMLEVDEEVATLMACDLLVAGLDNVHNGMLGLMYLLATNPEQQQKLREKLNTDERKMYMKAFIKESIRLLPVSSINLRRSTKDYNVLGYHIPKDTVLIFSQQCLMTSESQFPWAKEFLPERWLVGKDDPLYHGNAHPFAYLPFGFGARLCLGRRLAELQMETLLDHLMKNFTIEWRGPPPEINLVVANIIYARNFVLKDINPSSDTK